jgi:capsular exopolysaccharide synthesis family protein
MEQTNRRRSLVRTYLPLIVVVTLLTIGGTDVAILLRPAHYVSTGDVVVRPESLGGGVPVAPNMGTERQIAVSGDVTALAASNLGLTPEAALDGLSVSVPVDTTVLEFSYSAATAQTAYERAGVFARAYVAYRTGTESPPKAGPGSGPSTPASQPVVAIISPPTLPTAPAKPNYPLLLGLSLMVGAMLGAGCAFAWDRLSGKLRGSDDVEAQTGLPVIASVPALKVRVPEGIAVLSERRVRGAEAFGYLTARILHLLETRQASSLLITSPSNRAGKTTVAVNLAASLAAAGKRTVLVAADLRSATVHECFGLAREPGLTDVIRGKSTLAGALRRTDVPGLQVLTCGTAPAPTEVIFNVEDLALLLQRLEMTGAVVIFDAPAVLGHPETALLADRLDLVLMVVDRRRGSRADAVTAVSLLSDVEDALVGTVANDPGSRRRWPSRPHPPATVQSSPQPDVFEGSAQWDVEPADTPRAT